MVSKLEQKLTQYEKSTKISNDKELIDAIEWLLSEQDALPYEERDYDLIEEALDTLLRLQGLDVEDIDRSSLQWTVAYLDGVNTQKRATLDKPARRRRIKTKWIFPLVAVLTLLLSATVAAYAYGLDLVSMTADMIERLPLKTWIHNNDKDLIVSQDGSEYASLDEFALAEDISELLIPKVFPEGSALKSILVTDFGEYKDIRFLMIPGSTISSFSIQNPGKFETELEMVAIGNHHVYMYNYDGIYGAEFEFQGGFYSIEASSYDALEEIILGLEKGE